MNQHQLNQALIKDLRALQTNPPAIFIDQLDVEYDRILVASHFVDAVIEALDLNDKKLALLENLTRELANTLREMLLFEPGEIRNHPNVVRALDSLASVGDMLR